MAEMELPNLFKEVEELRIENKGLRQDVTRLRYTLRSQAAIAAMQGLLAFAGASCIKSCVEYSCQLADALIAELDKEVKA